MADHTEDALIREVNDDLREEQMMLLWKRYGSSIITVALLIVVIVAGYQGWKKYDISTRTDDGNRFYAASQLATSGNADKAIQAFGDLSLKSDSGYALLSQLRQAALMASQKDIAGATVLYQKIAHDHASDVAISGLANILGATLEINSDTFDKNGMMLRLETIVNKGSPYRYSAKELMGLVALKSGDMAKALEIFKSLTDDNATPKGIHERAKNLVEFTGQKN